MSLQQTIEKTDALKAELDALRPIQPEYEARLKQKFRLELTYNSNSIEGNSLTFGETKTLLLHGITTGNKPLQDYREVEAHNKVLLEIESLEDKRVVFSGQRIREYHAKMLGGEPFRIVAETLDGGQTTRLVTPGRYKIEPNHVRTITGETFYFEEPGAATEAAMTDLIDWCNKEIAERKLHPLVFATELHYRFIRIHPFDDGNGRMARILMNIILEISAYPPVIVLQEDKVEYLRSLRVADGGNVDTFTEYIGNRLLASLEYSISVAKGKLVE